MTGGENGLGGITRPLLARHSFRDTRRLLRAGRVDRLRGASTGSGASTARRSARVLVAIRENEQRARFVGYPTNRYKLVAFVVSAALTGLAGMLLLFNNRMTSAEPISVAFSGELLAMVDHRRHALLPGPGARRALLRDLPRQPLAASPQNWLL